MLNVFDNINFNHSINFNGGENAFRVTTAFTDINTNVRSGRPDRAAGVAYQLVG